MQELSQDKSNLLQLSDGDEAVCAFFIENPIAMRRVVCMMPHGNPTLDFLRKLYSYAVTRNRKVDLANALLAYDAKNGGLPQINMGRDWYCECDLPCECPEFFPEVRKYGWVRCSFDSAGYGSDDYDEVDSLLDFVKMVKENVGVGVVDMENILTKIKLKRNSILKAIKEAEKREGV